MLKRYSLAMFAMSLLMSATAAAQGEQRYPQEQHDRGRWVLLGQKRIEGHADNDRIDLGPRAGAFRALQFRVLRGGVRFDRILVTYGNGETDQLSVQSEIPSGGRTRAIDLPGNRRVISSIAMWYSRLTRRSHPTVKVYGMR
jgi:hypothetical protein